MIFDPRSRNKVRIGKSLDNDLVEVTDKCCKKKEHCVLCHEGFGMTTTTYGYDTAYCLKSHCGVRGYCRQKWVFQPQFI